MKLRLTILPLVVFGLFGYMVAKLDQVSDNGANLITASALKKEVKEDLADLNRALKKGEPIYNVNK